MKRISIIIPVYNAEQYIDQCLQSVLRQIKEEDELLLINDGSTDSSLEILGRYKEDYPNIIKIIDQKNQGTANTRNRGIEEAAGEYICFIDNDDFIDDGYLDEYYNAINNSQTDIVIGGYRRVSEKGIKFQVHPVQSDWFPFVVVAPWAKIYRKQFLIDNNIKFLDYGLGEDVYFSLCIYALNKKIKIISYCGYNWFYNESSISNTTQKGFKQGVEAVYLLNEIYTVGKKDKYFNYYYIRYVIWYLLFSGKSAEPTKFMEEYRKLFEWLQRRDIPLYFPLLKKKVLGENLSNRVIINIFLLAHKLKLVPVFAFHYCGKFRRWCS